MKRIPMVLQLARQPVAHDYTYRPVQRSDAENLAILLYSAFRGTIDDEGKSFTEAQREIDKTFAGDYGRLLFDSSFVIEQDGSLASACLISWYEPSAAPFVVFTMTQPTSKGEGMARFLLTQSINTLFKQEHTRLELLVTEGNEPAQNLYASLGFQVMEIA